MDYYTSRASSKTFIQVYDANDNHLTNSSFLSILLLVNAYADSHTQSLFRYMNFANDDLTRTLILSLRTIIESTLPTDTRSLVDISERSITRSTIWLYSHPFVKTALHSLVKTLITQLQTWLAENDTPPFVANTICYRKYLSKFSACKEVFKINTLVDSPQLELHSLLCTSILSAISHSTEQCLCNKPHIDPNSIIDIARPSISEMITSLSYALSPQSGRILETSFLCSIGQRHPEYRRHQKFNELLTNRQLKVKDFTINACNPLHNEYIYGNISRITCSRVFLRFEVEKQEHRVYILPSELLFQNISLENLQILLSVTNSHLRISTPAEFFDELLRQAKVLAESVSCLINAPPELLTHHQVITRYIQQRSSITLTHDNRGNTIRTKITEVARLWDLLYPTDETKSIGLSLLSHSVPALNDITSVSFAKSVAIVLHFARLTICNHRIKHFDTLIDTYPLRTIFPFSCSGLASSHFKNYISGIPTTEFPTSARNETITHMQSMDWYEIIISQITPLVPPIIPPPTIGIEALDKEELPAISKVTKLMKSVQQDCISQLHDELCLSSIATYGYVEPPTDISNSSYLDDFDILMDNE